MTNKKWLGWAAVLLWIGLIFFLTSQPAVDSNRLSKEISSIIIKIMESIGVSRSINVVLLNDFLRKAAHFFIFLVLSILIMFALSFKQARSNRKNMVYAFGISVALAVIDESIQLFVPGRGALISDVILDSAGAFVGIGLWWLFIGRRREKNH
jgi:VanZ family protein